MSSGAQLEGSSLEWLKKLDGLGDNSAKKTNAVLAVSAEQMLSELKGSYQKLIDSKGESNRYSAQQLAARISDTANKLGDLVGPEAKKKITDQMRQDLIEADKLGRKSGVDLSNILKDKTSSTRTPSPTSTPSRTQAGASRTSGIRRTTSSVIASVL